MKRLLVGCLTLVVLWGTAPRAMAATDKREMEAREYFAAGRYQEALDVFAKLYAEKLHPVFLRNIGRCYQNLAQPDRAISSFKEYLRKMKKVSADERAEIEGYIHEMEELQKKQTAAAQAPPPKGPVEPLPSATPRTQVSSTPPPPPPPLATSSPEGSGATGATGVVTAQSQPGSSSTDDPFYTRWWFWTVVGVVAIGAVVGTAVATGAFKSSDAPCTLADCK